MKFVERSFIVLALLTIALAALFPTATVAKGTSNGYVADYCQTHPHAGPQHTLVILVEFTDVRHSQNKSSIDALIFGQMAQYFTDVSYGQIQVVGRSIGWYTLPNTMAYYGEDISSDPGSDSHRVQLITDAFDAVSDSVSFNDYSEFMIVHAGIGQEDSPRISYLIWSDAYYGELSISTRQGVIIHSVAISPEMESGNHSPFGVYAHEYGHLLSLPDLYDASLLPGVPDDFVGKWSLMGTGVWLGNPNGTSPAELEAWSRIKLGWLVPDTFELTHGSPSFYFETLYPLETPVGDRAVKIQFSQNEYYLIEFRSRIDFDRYLPSEGLLIMSVDETKATGVVQVVDANASSRTLNDAAYGLGGVFNDTERGVVVDIIAGNSSTYSILFGNQSPSSFPLTVTRIVGPETINATYSQPVVFSVRLTDSSGNPVGGLPVRIQYYENDTWNDVGLSVTDGGGYANFNDSLTMKPGMYEVRYLFTGSRMGAQYYVGSGQHAILDIRKTETNVIPAWVYGAVGLIIVASSATGYFIFRIRRRTKSPD